MRFQCYPQCHKCFIATKQNMILLQERGVLEDSKTVFSFSVSALLAELFQIKDKASMQKNTFFALFLCSTRTAIF